MWGTRFSPKTSHQLSYLRIIYTTKAPSITPNCTGLRGKMRTNQAPRGNEIESTKKKRFFPINLAGSRPTTLLSADTELIWLKETKPTNHNHNPNKKNQEKPATDQTCPNHI